MASLQVVRSLPLNTVPSPLSGLKVSVILIATDDLDKAWNVMIDEENNNTGNQLASCAWNHILG